MIPRLSIDLFAATAATRTVLDGLSQNRELMRCRLQVMDGGIDGAIAHYADKPTPQVVVVEEGEGASNDLPHRLDRLAEVCEPTTRVLVIGGINDIRFYRHLIGRGVSDYLPRPVAEDHVLDALRDMFSDARNVPRGKSVCFWPVRGGVGSSTLAQNFAWLASQQLREPVLYLDLDLSFGTSLLAYNLEAKQTVADSLNNPDRLDDVLLERYLIEYDDHLRILASSGDCRTESRATLDGIDKLIELSQRLAALVVIDLPHVWCDWTRHLLAQSDEVILTATPDIPCLRDAKAMQENLESPRAKAAAPRLVLNRLDAYRKTQLTPKDFAANANLDVALTLPFEPLLFGDAANRGEMLGECAPSHKVVQSLRQFVAQVTGKAPVKSKKAADLSVAGVMRWLKK